MSTDDDNFLPDPEFPNMRPTYVAPPVPRNPLTRLIQYVRTEKWAKEPTGSWHMVGRIISFSSDGPRDGDTRYLREYLAHVITYVQAPCGKQVSLDVGIMQNKRPQANVCRTCLRLVNKTEGEGAQE